MAPMATSPSSTPRRGFLGAIAAAFGFSLLPAAKISNVALMNGNDAERWIGLIQGKHKQVFDGTSPANAYPLSGAWVFLNTYNELGTPDTELGALVVLRHDAICLALADTLWEKYKLGEYFKVTDKMTNTSSLRNIFWQSKQGDLRSPDMAIDRLQTRGVKFCVCAVAIGRISGVLAKQMNLDAAEVKKEWLSGILPGILVVPAGVWALSQAQEHDMTYCFAS